MSRSRSRRSEASLGTRPGHGALNGDEARPGAENGAGTKVQKRSRSRNRS